MAEKQLTLREIDTKIKALDVKIEKAQQTLVNLKADKKTLTAEQAARRRQNATKTSKRTTVPKKATTTKKKSATAAKTTTKKATAKKTSEDSNDVLGDLMEGLLNNKDIADALGSLLGNKK